jgi:hypothetical protein
MAPATPASARRPGVTTDGDFQGWAWFEAARPGGPPEEEAAEELGGCFAACFGRPEGEVVLDHLRRLILDRRCPPGASDAELRHLEGQRFAVAYILQMVERGRAA